MATEIRRKVSLSDYYLIASDLLELSQKIPNLSLVK
jgi:hypothetical protein